MGMVIIGPEDGFSDLRLMVPRFDVYYRRDSCLRFYCVHKKCRAWRHLTYNVRISMLSGNNTHWPGVASSGRSGAGAGRPRPVDRLQNEASTTMLRDAAVRRPTALLVVLDAARPPLTSTVRLRLGARQLHLRPNSQPGDERLSGAPGMPRPEVSLSGHCARVDGEMTRRRGGRSTGGRRHDLG